MRKGGGGGEGVRDKLVGMQLHVCACVCGRDMQILYFVGFSKSDSVILSWLYVHIPSVAFQLLGI